jgi:galactan endo-beta-1,3-galactanase
MSIKQNATIAGFFIGLFGSTHAQAGWVNNGTLPWGAHTGPGNQYYVTENASQISGGWRLSATQPGTNDKKYKSGAIYDSDTIKLRSDKAIGAQASVNVNNAKVRGTWPAFWITSTGGWTAEVDIAEWKGSATVWQNTYDGGWESKLTNNSSSGTYKTHIEAKNDGTNDAWVYLYINNNWTATHTGSNFVGKDLFVLANLQMEGDSGSPGPDSASFDITGYSAWGF